MPVMSEILIGKNPSQSVSQINLSLDTTLAANGLICWFFLGGKGDQVRKDSTIVFELCGIWALHSNINWFVSSLSCLINLEVLFSTLQAVVTLEILLYDSSSSLVHVVYIHKHIHLHIYTHTYTRTDFKKACMLIFILTILSKCINNTFIVVYIQLSSTLYWH